jgi:hypothetical protein
MQRGDAGTQTDEKRMCSSPLLSFLVISTAIYLLPVSTMGKMGVLVRISRVISWVIVNRFILHPIHLE